LTVRDNAGGIDPRIRDRIFEPYVSTKAVKQTTGLGLSNARAIMALLDGRLDLAAIQPADGSEFTLQF
jgi:signal transduction histidine kinase